MDIYVNPDKIEGQIRGAVAIDSFVPGATIQLGSGSKAYVVAGRDVEFAPEDGWDQIVCTGTITLKVYRAPFAEFGKLKERPGFRATQGATDASGNTKVVGPEAPNGAASATNPVQVGASQGAGAIRRLQCDANGFLIVGGNGAQAAAPNANPLCVAGWDGANAYRLRTDINGRLSIVPYETNGGNAAVGRDGVDTIGAGFLGTLFVGGKDRSAAGPLASMISVDNRGVQRATVPNGWNVEHAPAAATLATITKAAGGANTYHVVTDIEIEVAAAAAASGILAVTITDGAIVKTFRLQAAINANDRVLLTGLAWHFGANLAVTLAFAGAGPAGSFEKVTMCGYTTTAQPD